MLESFSILRTVAVSIAAVANSITLGATSVPLAATAQRYVFSTSLSTFITLADSSTYDPRFDWTSDGCSAPVVGSTGASFDFTRPCRRHDFAYRNFPVIDNGILWNEKMRKRVDDQFLRDMKSTCSPRPSYVRIRCNVWADIFYRSVRLYPGL